MDGHELISAGHRLETAHHRDLAGVPRGRNRDGASQRQLREDVRADLGPAARCADQHDARHGRRAVEGKNRPRHEGEAAEVHELLAARVAEALAHAARHDDGDGVGMLGDLSDAHLLDAREGFGLPHYFA